MKKYLLVFIILIASFLRLWKLSLNPPSLFGDELDLGYQAYSILKTGKDYYGNFMPLHFHSLAEWRTPLYLYSAVPTVAIFGISPLGVRLPASIFGIVGVYFLFLLVREMTKSENLSLTSAAVFAFSPWHIQYSRAGFEVTLMLFLLLMGLYFFLKSFKNGKYILLSAVSFCLTPWVYSTAKLFIPILMIFLLLLWKREIFAIPRKYLAWAIVIIFLIGGSIIYSTFFGGGTQRYSYISVFTDPTTESEVGAARLIDARVRGQTGEGLTPSVLDRIIHNKYTFWFSNTINNFFQSFSTQFLFIKGDINLRHSIGIGEFYKIEALVLALGLIFFFTRFKNHKIKFLILFWLLVGIIPSAITREGGMHATRLILILPPLIFLISFGIYQSAVLLKGNYRKLFILFYVFIFLIGLFSYQHKYWSHYSWESERWWHAGWGEAIKYLKTIDKDYERVILSMSGEPAWIFFAGWYEYPPLKWQTEFPVGNDEVVSGFGKISHIDKFYFGSPLGGIYSLGNFINAKTLYLANAKEIGANLILEPGRTPDGLNLVKAFSFPSGEPAFYLFSGVFE